MSENDLWVIWTELANSYFKRIEKRGFMMTLSAYFPDQCSQYASESRLVLLLFHATGRPLPSTRQNHFMLEISSPTWFWQGRQTHKSDVVKNTVMWTFLKNKEYIFIFENVWLYTHSQLVILIKTIFTLIYGMHVVPPPFFILSALTPHLLCLQWEQTYQIKHQRENCSSGSWGAEADGKLITWQAMLAALLRSIVQFYS